MVKPVLCAAAAAALLACSSSASQEAAAVEAPPAAPLDAVPATTSSGIVKIQTRDRSVTLLAGHGGRRVTIEDDHGRVIAKDVDVDELEAIDARSYELVRSTVAGRTSADLGN